MKPAPPVTRIFMLASSGSAPGSFGWLRGNQARRSAAAGRRGACARRAPPLWRRPAAATASTIAACSALHLLHEVPRRASLPRVTRIASVMYCFRGTSSSRPNAGCPPRWSARWKARSSATPSPPPPMLRSIALSARRRPASAPPTRVWAGRRISPSNARRTSRTLDHRVASISNTLASKAGRAAPARRRRTAFGARRSSRATNWLPPRTTV